LCDIVGRISADTVWDYISKMKKVGSKVNIDFFSNMLLDEFYHAVVTRTILMANYLQEIMVVRFAPTSPEDKQNYNSYYSYLLSRKR
jgi:hypothetical protein